jgi:hypothetical protein
VTKKLQKHIGESAGKIIKVDDARQTLVNESKLRAKALNSIKLSNCEEIITDNFEVINSQESKQN